MFGVWLPEDFLARQSVPGKEVMLYVRHEVCRFKSAEGHVRKENCGNPSNVGGRRLRETTPG